MACASPPDEDHLFECPVCMEIMKEPKQLPCGHSLCNSCMDKLTARDFTVSCVGSDVECPTCRKHSQVPHDGFPTNYPLSAIIRRHLNEQQKQRHKCMMCDKLAALDDMILCHSCGDMSLCWSCCFSSHDGHQREKLQNHMDNEVKQLKQWKDDKSLVLESLTVFPSKVFNRCKSLIDQQQNRQLNIGQKRKEFEGNLCGLIDSSEHELNASNGYKFDFASLDDQLQSIQDEHKQSTTKRQELVDSVSKMLLSSDDDLSEAVPMPLTQTGILLTDGQYFEFYSPSTNRTQLIDIEIQKHYGFVMEVLSDGRVMVAGGYNRANDQSAPTLIIDLISKQVMQGPPMTTGRRNAGSAMIGGEMYVCGGYDEEYNTLSSCEVYRDGQWTPIAHMNVPRFGHAVVALDGLLYAIGGPKDRVNKLNSVECYSPEADSWQFVSSLNVPRLFLSAAAFNGCIYAAGGFVGVQSCERYSPNQNRWETVASMNKGRQMFSLVSFSEKLYALGGDYDRENTVENYDAEKNEWKMENVTLKTDSFKAVVVDYSPN